MQSENSIRFLLAQQDFIVGDLIANHAKIDQTLQCAYDNSVNVVIFPEMALCGYPIQDLILDNDFYETQMEIIRNIAKNHPELVIILGGFGVESDPSHHPKYQNLAYVISKGQIITQVQKRLLPTYDVFDENRYFWSGNNYDPVNINGINFGIAICEDLWDENYQNNVAAKLVQQGAQAIISINGSPYIIEKQKIREELVKKKAQKFHIPFFYLNLIGGQDELVFDGRSFIINQQGNVIARAPFCKENIMLFDLNKSTLDISIIPAGEFINISEQYKSHESIVPLCNVNEEIVEALCMNLHDYYYKTGIFRGVVLGLSGGIDSAFTAYVAAKAVGKELVTAILLPSKYSSKGSIDDSIELCNNLGIKYQTVPIKNVHGLMEFELLNIFTDEARSSDLDLACQNLQSRLRGVILMFYSNLYGALVISTGNKSEIATGYCTLYGDTNGGKNIPGDIYKTQLYEIVEWINRDQEIIPKNIITKPPSAELKEDQVDQDNLPPYPILDEILQLRIDEGYSPREIIAMGKDEALVRRIDSLYTHNEYKRAQLSQTIKINKKTFGMGRKMPTLKQNKY